MLIRSYMCGWTEEQGGDKQVGVHVGPKNVVFWDVLTAVTMEHAFWDIIPCGSSKKFDIEVYRQILK
jgi:hypothetical protein